GAEAVEDHRRATGVAVSGAGGLLYEDALDEHLGDLVGRAKRLVAHTGLAVDAEADAHLPLGHVEQRLVAAGDRAAVEGDAEGSCGVIRLPRDALGLVDVGARLEGRARGPEDGEG